MIEDNCGGIPLEVAERYAFRMGRPKGTADDDDIFTIGTYGIGMKRAIFKMGRSARVRSQTIEDAFNVMILPAWLASDNSWELPVESIENDDAESGTLIEITDLREDVFDDPDTSPSAVGEACFQDVFDRIESDE